MVVGTVPRQIDGNQFACSMCILIFAATAFSVLLIWTLYLKKVHSPDMAAHPAYSHPYTAIYWSKSPSLFRSRTEFWDL